GFLCVVVQILLKRLVAFAWHCQVTGKSVVERRNISGALDRSMAAQGEDSAAGSANISKQQLQNRCRANDLRAFGMLRPSYCVTNRRGAFRSGCGSERMRHFVKKIRRNATDFLDHLGRVTGEMPFYLLKDTLRVLQCEV